MQTYSSVVIDAGIGVYMVIQGSLSPEVESQWEAWIRDDIHVCAPGLWRYELTSVLHRLCMQKLIDPDEALQALDAALGLGVEIDNHDAEACWNAFDWATRMGQSQAYDGFYLSLAEKQGAAFWTTDARLARRASQLGIDWVYVIPSRSS